MNSAASARRIRVEPIRIPVSIRFVLALACLLAGGCVKGPTLQPYRIASEYSVEDPQFARVVGSLLGPPLVPGNSVVTLVNGREFYPQMLAAIRSARTSITFETFVYWSGDIGEQFTQALCDRARSGVRVHIMIDAAGSDRIDKDYIRRLSEAGAQVDLFNPLRWYDIGSFGRFNNRTHRKVLVIDGTVGFTGGAGVADEWHGDAQSKDHWRDNHYRLEGPAVAQLQAAFVEHWMQINGGVLHSEAYFPALQDKGPLLAQVFRSSPRSGSESMQLMYLLSIAAARKELLISTPYFVVDKTTTWHLVEARRRGVRVRIIVPDENIDYPIVRQASHARWGPLLKAGIEIHEYQGTLYHVKLMVVDGFWTSIGSANFDNRSFKINSEANLNVLDREFAQRQVELFENDLKRARRVTYEQWKRRPLFKRIGESLANLFGTQL